TSQDLEVDAAHDLGSHEAPGVLGWQLVSGAAIVAGRPLALATEQAHQGRGEAAGSKVVLGHAESFQILGRQVDAAADDVGADVANDVGQLQCQPEVLGVGPG